MKTTSCALALLGSLLSAGSAFAHAHLKTSNPADGTTITAMPSALSLSFSEGLELKLSGATLKGSDGKQVATGAASLGPNDDKRMSIPVPGPLSAGTYTVDWHAFSNDGHTTHGSYQFTIAR
jgi:methionine-rich copper-binding protein CopC